MTEQTLIEGVEPAEQPVAWVQRMPRFAPRLFLVEDFPDMDKKAWAEGITIEPLYAAEDVQRLRAEVEALRADAERYRWLRTAGAWESEIGLEVLKDDPERFDAAIDAAMKEQP